MFNSTTIRSMLIVFLYFGSSQNQSFAVETSRWDTLFTSTGQVMVGEIVGFDSNSITIKNKANFGTHSSFRFNQIERVSTRSWTILMIDGSIIKEDIITFHSDPTIGIVTPTRDSISMRDIGAIYALNSSIEKKCNGAMTGSMAGALISSVLTSKLRTTEYDGEFELLNSINPIAYIGGGIWGRKRGGRKLELQILHINPILIGTMDYESGRQAGLRSPSGNLVWLFNGLALNVIAPIYALKYKPVPDINRLEGNTGSFIVGYIDGYGDKAKLKNVLFSTIGAGGNSMIVIAIIISKAIAGDPNFTN